MSEGPGATKAERIKEFLGRLAAAPAARDHDEALGQVSTILIAVEDEMTSIPFDPTFPVDDGRMYPPLPDSKKAVPGLAGVTRYRNKGHSTLIGDNGAVAIRDHSSGEIIFSKPGADGRAI